MLRFYSLRSLTLSAWHACKSGKYSCGDWICAKFSKTTQTTAFEETNPFVDDEKLAAKLALCRNELLFLNVASW